MFVGWNLTSEDKRLVGSGAYVARLHAWVSIKNMGKVEGTNLTRDEIWGVIRNSNKAAFIK